MAVDSNFKSYLIMDFEKFSQNRKPMDVLQQWDAVHISLNYQTIDSFDTANSISFSNLKGSPRRVSLSDKECTPRIDVIELHLFLHTPSLKTFQSQL